MSAPLLNASLFQAPGPAAGAGQGVAAGAGQAAAGGGVMAGFEALLAALFGQIDPAGVAIAQPGLPASPQAALAGDAAQTVDPAMATDAKGDKDKSATDAKDAAPDCATPDAALALLAAAAGAAPILVQPATTPAPGDGQAATAVGGDGQAKAAPQPTTAFDLAAATTAATTAALKAVGQPAAEASAKTEPPATAPAGAADKDAAALAFAKLTDTTAAPKPTAAPSAKPAEAATAPATAAPVAAQDAVAPTAPVAPTPPAAQTAQDAPAKTTAEQAAPAAPAAQAQQAAQTQAPAPPPARDAAPRRERTGGKTQAASLEPAAGLHAMTHAPRADGVKIAPPTPAEAAAATAPGAEQADGAAAKPAKGDDGGPAFDQTDPNNTAAPVQTPAMQAAQAAVRGAPQTVANLAAQIIKKLEAKTTRFDVQLDPVGLGKVDVRVEIGAEGRVTAALACHNPQGQAELKARSAELQQALEQAGFDVSNGGLSFEMAGGQGGGAGAGQGQNDSGQAFRGRAFQTALDTAGDAAQAAAQGALRLDRSRLSGVDIRI